jgi:type III restriction enzyme
MTSQVGAATIDQLIIGSHCEELLEHWKYDRQTRRFTREPGRRPAGYVRASEASKSFDDPGEFVELPLVNQIRPRVKARTARPSFWRRFRRGTTTLRRW